MERYLEPSRDISDLTFLDLDYRRPLYKEGFPFVIFWSEKAACTVVSKWFFLQLGQLDEALRYSKWIHNYEARFIRTNKVEYLESVVAALKAGVPAIKFVRDPYARAYSGYLEMQRPGALTNPTNWATQARRTVISEIATPNASIEYTFSFRQYLLWRATKRNNEVDAHLAEQYVPRDRFIRMRAVKIENARLAFQRLEEEFDLPVRSAEHDHIFSSDHHHDKGVGYSAEEIEKIIELGVPLRRPPTFRLPKFARDIALRTGLDDLVRVSFGRDIELYGYGPATETLGDAPRNSERDFLLAANLSLASERNQLLLANRQLIVERDQTALELGQAVRRNALRKERLDSVLAQPGVFRRWVLDNNIFVFKLLFEKIEVMRLTNLNFDTQYYLDCNPDVKKSGVQPLLHFVRHGRREGRQFRLEE